MSELEPTITKLEPTATERLRALLTERGVEWETDRSGFRVMWGKPVDEFHDTMQFKAVDNALPNGGLNVHICGFTPEQAIAATLGSCNCSNDCTNSERTWTCRLENFADVPFSVDYEIEGYDMGSSKDYATLAECNSCGAYVIVPPEYHHVLTCDGDEVYQPYRFCPACGRRVVDE